MIAYLEASRAGLLRREHWLPNIVSGVIVGVVALPLAMAFAIASGAKPQQGLYTAIVAGLVVSIFGGSRVQIAGPTGAFIVILAGVTAKHGIDGLQIATFMAGLMLLALGVGRMGTIIKYIPDPVIAGFTAGIGTIIWVGQWKDFFGLPPADGAHFHEKLWHLLQALPQLHAATTMLAVVSLLVVIFSTKVPGLRRVPGPLTALVLATGAQAAFSFDGVATIGSAFGSIPRGLPPFQLPEVSATRVIELLGPAFAIAMLGAIESLLSAVVADGMAGTRHDSNQELIGQGIANIAAPLFGGFAATGAIARTATNIRNGATGPLAGLVHSAVLVLIILLLAPLASTIPLCCLSAVLFVVAWNMSELPHVARLVRTAPKTDVAVLLLTFLLTVFVDLVVAVNVGVIVAALFFMRRMADAVSVEQHVDTTATSFDILGPKPDSGIVIYSIEGPLFFGAAEKLERTLAHIQRPATTLILRMGSVPFIDATGINALEEMVGDFRRHGASVLLVELRPNVRYKLERAGVIAQVGEEHVIDTLDNALQLAKRSRKAAAAKPPVDV